MEKQSVHEDIHEQNPARKDIRMIYIETNSNRAAENLAFEEYFLKKEACREPIVMLWRNRPVIVVGAYQNTFEEINEDFVKEHNIDVVRRISGGGAVYQDLGNLCFSFIMEREDFSNTDYSIFLAPVVKALTGMGVPAEINGRNDLVVEGRKISGSATRIYKNRLLFHGTLLYSSDLKILAQALNVSRDKLVSKGIKSVRSRVTTISGYLPEKTGVLQFKAILKKALGEAEGMSTYEPDEKELQEICSLALHKYQSFDWIYGKNPPTDMCHSRRFSGGGLKVLLTLKKSLIHSVKFQGDFLGCMEMDYPEALLVGKPYEKGIVEKALESIELTPYFGSITKEELVSCIMGEEDPKESKRWNKFV